MIRTASHSQFLLVSVKIYATKIDLYLNKNMQYIFIYFLNLSMIYKQRLDILNYLTEGITSKAGKIEEFL